MGSVVHIAPQDAANNVHRRVDTDVDQGVPMDVLENAEITVLGHVRHA